MVSTPRHTRVLLQHWLKPMSNLSIIHKSNASNDSVILSVMAHFQDIFSRLSLIINSCCLFPSTSISCVYFWPSRAETGDNICGVTDKSDYSSLQHQDYKPNTC